MKNALEGFILFAHTRELEVMHAEVVVIVC